MFDFVHEFDLAARPSVSEISTCFWQQNSVQMMLKEIMWSWQLSVDRVSDVNLFLSPLFWWRPACCPECLKLLMFFWMLFAHGLGQGPGMRGPIGWNKFTYFSVYWQKVCMILFLCKAPVSFWTWVLVMWQGWDFTPGVFTTACLICSEQLQTELRLKMPEQVSASSVPGPHYIALYWCYTQEVAEGRSAEWIVGR